MSQSSKKLIQFRKAKSAINLLYQDTKDLNDFEDLKIYLDNFIKIIQQTSNEKNHTNNKSIIAFKNFYEKEKPKSHQLQTVIKKGTIKKRSYLDYIEEYRTLRAKGKSWRDISDYSYKHFKIKVSKDTLRLKVGDE